MNLGNLAIKGINRAKSEARFIAPLLNQIKRYMSFETPSKISKNSADKTLIEHFNFFDKKEPNNRLYFYHTTQLKNLSGIHRIGLNPQMGSSLNGCASLSRNFSFNRASSGLVHATPSIKAVNFYIRYINNELSKKGCTDITAAPIVLRFKKDLNVWKTDPNDRYGMRSNSIILPQNIEVFTNKKWVTLTDLQSSQAKIKLFPKQVYTY